MNWLATAHGYVVFKNKIWNLWLGGVEKCIFKNLEMSLWMEAVAYYVHKLREGIKKRRKNTILTKEAFIQYLAWTKLEITELNFYLQHSISSIIGYLKHEAFYVVKHQIKALSGNMEL